MALSGFAEGALAGFGAVNKFYDNQRRRELEQQQLDDRKKDRADTQDFRRQQLEAQEEDTRLLRGIQKTQAKTSARRAETDSQRATTAQLVAENTSRGLGLEERKQDRVDAITGPDGLTPQMRAEKKRTEAQTEEIRLRNEGTAFQQEQTRDALTLQRMVELTEQDAPLSATQIAEFDSDVETLSKSRGIFNIGRIISQTSLDDEKNIDRVIAQLQSGQSFQMTPRQTEAVGNTLGINNPSYRGMMIDDTFVNAPPEMRGGNFRIKETGLFSVNLTKDAAGDPAFNGFAVVLAENSDGDLIPYPAPITEFRSTTDTNPINVSLQNFTDAEFGSRVTRQFIRSNPRIRALADDALIKNKYGKRETFDKEVDREMRRIEEAVQAGRSEIITGYTEDDENLRDLLLNQQETLRQRVTDRLLRGIDPPDFNERVRKFYEDERKELAREPLPGGRVAGTNLAQRQRRGLTKPQTLGDVFPRLTEGPIDEETARLITNLSLLYDKNGLKISEDEFEKRLKAQPNDPNFPGVTTFGAIF